uniref:Nucleoprotein n=1 Tax=Orthobunyavirus tacaiumaense TaxID=3052444 RepID=A0A7D9MVG7_9VIRU|nr:N [Orthobunyavirus tacaiumaense] [Orthobunyavirus tacaiumaense]
MSGIDFIYDDPGRIQQSDFVPREEYAIFCSKFALLLTLQNLRIFFLNAGKLKSAMKQSVKRKIKAKFGTLEVEITNTHNRAFTDVKLEKGEITLHRLSGFLARKILDLYTAGNYDLQAQIKAEIVMPLAEVAGVNWENANPEIYLSFAPGSEFFLADFKFYPLAIGIARVKKDLMKPEFLAKLLRQRYGSMTPGEWMKTHAVAVQSAVAKIEEYPLMKVNSRPHVEEFLKAMGLPMHSISGALKG